jgi:hypothetical protein
MEKRTIVPIAIAAIVAITCTAILFVTDFGGPAQGAKDGGITMITASVVNQAGATAVPTLP